MSKFNVEQGVPVPKSTGAGRKTNYPFESMQVGDSFFIKDGKVKTVSRSCGIYSKRFGCKFISRTVEGGARVWRVE